MLKTVFRRSLKVFIPLILVTSSITLFLLHIVFSTDSSALKSTEKKIVQAQSSLIDTEISTIKGELIYLSQSVDIKNILDNDPEMAKHSLQIEASDYIRLIQSRKIYDQIRLIRDDGMEIVRVNYNGGNPQKVEPENLQNKKSRYYFSETIKLDEGDIYLSPFDLNIENSKIEIPFKPMIRFGTPVTTYSGEKKGILIINYLGGKILGSLNTMTPINESIPLLLNSEGFWIKSVVETDDWGFMFEDGREKTIFNRFPESAEYIMNEESGQIITGEGLFTFQKIFPKKIQMQQNCNSGEYSNSADKNYFWIYVSYIPIEKYRNNRFFIITLVSGIYLLLSVLFWSILWKWSLAVEARKRSDKRLIKAHSDAENANKAKSIFLANMSHEIRTPMNAIIGLNNLLQRTDLDSRQLDYVSKTNESAQILLGIINDILDFSKIEAGKLEIEYIEFELNELLNSITNIITDKIEEKELELLIIIKEDVPCNIIGDPLRLRQILLNLLSNAVKFTEKGEITIECSVLENNHKWVKLQFSISDTGCGLTEEQTLKLFSSFIQADTSTTRLHGGSGLGLSISKQLIELMNGEIDVESTVGVGSRFWFSCKFDYTQKEGIQNIVPQALQQMKYLVVDDNESARIVLKNYLNQFSLRAEIAEDGYKALEMIRNDTYDVVFLDWKMPGKTGLHVAREIKESGMINQPHIIIVTGYGREEIFHECKDLNLKGILLKPVSPSLLFDTLMNVFDNKGFRKKTELNSSNHMVLPDLSGIRILLAEDNEINQLVVKDIIETQGAEVLIVSNGREALNALSENDIDIVLMDGQMPVMDGYESAKEIRKMDKFQSLPIIAMTANVMRDQKELAYQSGMNDFISKPINMEQLFSVLEKWIDKSQNKSDLTSIQDTRMDRIFSLTSILPGLNIKYGLSMVHKNEKLYLRLLMIFLKNNENCLPDVQKNIKEKDYEQARKIIHKLSSAAGNIGAEDLHEAAMNLEKAIFQKEYKDLPNKFDIFAQELKLATTSMYRIVDSSGSVPETEQIAILIKEIYRSLDSDLVLAREKIQVLSPYLSNSIVSGSFEDVKKAVNSFDTDRAAEYLLKIADELSLDPGGIING